MSTLNQQTQRWVESLEFIFDHYSVMVAYYDADLRCQMVNQQYANLFGFDESDLINKRLVEVINKKRFDKVSPNMQRALNGEKIKFQTRISTPTKDRVYFEVKYVPDRPVDGKIPGIYAFIRNIDDTVREKQAHDLLRYAVDQSMEGLSIHSKEGKILYANPAEAALYGYEVEEILGNTFRMYYDQAEIDLIENQYFPILMQKGKWRGTIKARKKNGEQFFEEVSLTALIDEKDEFDGLICTNRDITEKKRTQDQLRYLAHYDHLTGLANRLLFKDKLKQLIGHAQRREEMVAVFFLDLDDFKHINDSRGHNIGDKLITIIANMLKDTFRPEDALSRLGGDEFTIAVGGITSRIDAINIADKMQ
jgi:PAS domain S-box-containing protein